MFTLVVAIGEYGTDASIRYWSLIRNQEIEDVKFERVMRYYRAMGILFGAIYYSPKARQIESSSLCKLFHVKHLQNSS